MKLTFLGTGTSQGVPMIGCKCAVCASPDARDKRLRSSVMISSDVSNVVIDTGPDFRQQMLREGVDHLEAVVFTHEHKDHIAGLDDIRAFNYLTKSKMEVFCTTRVEQALKREFAYAFTEFKYPGIPEIELVNIERAPFEVAGMKFTPIEVLHLKMPVLGFRIGDLTYITDANYISEAEKEKIRGSKILILNALRHEPHPSHFTLKEALQLVDELRPEDAFFTHISHQLGTHKEVEMMLPAHVHLAYDGLQIQF